MKQQSFYFYFFRQVSCIPGRMSQNLCSPCLNLSHAGITLVFCHPSEIASLLISLYRRAEPGDRQLFLLVSLLVVGLRVSFAWGFLSSFSQQGWAKRPHRDCLYKTEAKQTDSRGFYVVRFSCWRADYRRRGGGRERQRERVTGWSQLASCLLTTSLLGHCSLQKVAGCQWSLCICVSRTSSVANNG